MGGLLLRYQSKRRISLRVEQWREPWHDVHIQVQGPLAASLARVFLRTWIAKTATRPREDPQSDLVLHERDAVLVSQSPVFGPHFTHQHDILDAYCSLIRNAKRYIYIENQFFVTDAGGTPNVRNQVAKAILQRMQTQTNLVLIVVLPCHPEGNPWSKNSLPIMARQAKYALGR